MIATRPIPILTGEQRARFFSCLERTEGGCLLWAGTVNKEGYGLFWLGDHRFLAHRIAFTLAGGVFTEDNPICLHDCPGGDNARCCEPAHLRAGSVADNVVDASIKGQAKKSKRGLPYGVKRHHRKDGPDRFEARVAIPGQGKVRYLGLFDSIEEAAAIAAANKPYAAPGISR